MVIFVEFADNEIGEVFSQPQPLSFIIFRGHK